MREVGQLVDLVFSEVKSMFDNLKDEDICKAAHMCAHDGKYMANSGFILRNLPSRNRFPFALDKQVC